MLTRGEGASLRILLGKRKVEPQPDWWFVGGRTRPGDTPAEGAARNVKRELGLAIETRRFVHVNTYSFVWNYRQQAPSTNGTADASTVFELPLTQAEADGLGPSKFDEKEYADAAWVGPLDILEGDYHPALQQAVRDLLAQRAYSDLRNVAGGPPAAVARCARRSLPGRRPRRCAPVSALRRRQLPVRRHGRRPRAAADEGVARLSAAAPICAARRRLLRVDRGSCVHGRPAVQVRKSNCLLSTLTVQELSYAS